MKYTILFEVCVEVDGANEKDATEKAFQMISPICNQENVWCSNCDWYSYLGADGLTHINPQYD